MTDREFHQKIYESTFIALLHTDMSGDNLSTTADTAVQNLRNAAING